MKLQIDMIKLDSSKIWATHSDLKCIWTGTKKKETRNRQLPSSMGWDDHQILWATGTAPELFPCQDSLGRRGWYRPLSDHFPSTALHVLFQWAGKVQKPVPGKAQQNTAAKPDGNCNPLQASNSSAVDSISNYTDTEMWSKSTCSHH